VELLAVLLDLEPEPRTPEPPLEPWQPEVEPSSIEMLLRGAAALATQPLKALRFQRRTLQAMGRYDPASAAIAAVLPATANLGAAGLALVDRVVTARLPRPKTKEGEIIQRPAQRAPRTVFNATISPHRRFAFGALSLDTAKEVKSAFGVTVNDVVLSICGGGLRRYLQDRGELPAESLLAMVPVSLRAEDAKGVPGNQTSAVIAALGTEEADPVTRLRKVHESMAIAKEEFKLMPADLLADYTEFATPALTARASRAVARTRLADVINVPFNLTVSNIPGPNFPLYGAGARLIGCYPVSAITDGVGLNITVMSYMGDLDFGIVADREMLPDAQRLLDHMGDALDELAKAAHALDGR
jgi:WS/DGAT/MGAT family acyltransferase